MSEFNFRKNKTTPKMIICHTDTGCRNTDCKHFTIGKWGMECDGYCVVRIRKCIGYERRLPPK
jgi:hypothetical protein